MNASYAILDQMVINVYFHLYNLRKNLSIKHSKLLYAHVFWAEPHFKKSFLTTNSRTRSWSPFSFPPTLLFPVHIIHAKIAVENQKFLYIQLMIHMWHESHQLELA